MVIFQFAMLVYQRETWKVDWPLSLWQHSSSPLWPTEIKHCLTCDWVANLKAQGTVKQQVSFYILTYFNSLWFSLVFHWFSLVFHWFSIGFYWFSMFFIDNSLCDPPHFTSSQLSNPSRGPPPSAWWSMIHDDTHGPLKINSVPLWWW